MKNKTSIIRKIGISFYAMLAIVFPSCMEKELTGKHWLTIIDEEKKNAPYWAKYYYWDGNKVVFLKTFYELQYESVQLNGLMGLTWGTVNQENFMNSINFPPPVTKEEAGAIRAVKYNI